jgi:hypothetical protein
MDKLRGRHHGKGRPSAFEHEKYREDWMAREISHLPHSYLISKLCNDDLSLSVFLHFISSPCGNTCGRSLKKSFQASCSALPLLLFPFRAGGKLVYPGRLNP